MKASREKNRRLFGDLAATAVVAILFCVLLLTVVFSAFSYRRAVAVQERNDDIRAVLSYVVTAVKSDEAAAVSVTEKEGIPVLMIDDGETGYARQIYAKDGKICEVYAKKNASLTAGESIMIGSSALFEIDAVNEELLVIRTGLGSSYVRIRQGFTEGGGV